MFKSLKGFFIKPKKSAGLKTESNFKVNAENYLGLKKSAIVLKGCQEFENFSEVFTSKMIFEYLEGIIDFDDLLKAIHYLVKKGEIRKVTVLASNNEGFKHKMFYALNKKE